MFLLSIACDETDCSGIGPDDSGNIRDECCSRYFSFLDGCCSNAENNYLKLMWVIIMSSCDYLSIIVEILSLVLVWESVALLLYLYVYASVAVFAFVLVEKALSSPRAVMFVLLDIFLSLYYNCRQWKICIAKNLSFLLFNIDPCTFWRDTALPSWPIL